MNDIVVDVAGLHRSFQSKPALRNVSLQIPEGCVFGLVGENGAGKTTLLNHLLGLLKPTSGSVRVFGLDPVQNPSDVLGRIGYLSEQRDLPAWMRIDQLMSYTRGFFPQWDQSFADELIEMFGLDPGQRLKSLSRGQIARVGLLAAIAHRPDFLLLDEPSSGLDPVVRRDILTAIIRTVADDGRTVLFSSHLLDEVQRVSDHIAILHEGELILCKQLEAVLEEHIRLTVRLPEATSSAPVIPGAINCQGDGAEWNVLCNGRRKEVEQWALSMQAEIMEARSPSLEEIFVGHVGRPCESNTEVSA